MFKLIKNRAAFVQMCALLPGLLIASSSYAFSNQAATFCVNKGGDRQLIKTPTERFGVCNLGGAIIEEWTLLRGAEGNQSLQAWIAYSAGRPPLGESRGNPASGNCIHQGGRGVFGKDQTGGELGMCKFPDGSMIEEWTLFFGFASTRNDALNQVLNTGG